MGFGKSLVISFLFCSQIFIFIEGKPPRNGIQLEEEGIQYLNGLEPRYSAACNAEMEARWKYITNVTEHNEQEATKAKTEFLNFQASIQKEIADQFGDEWQDYENEFAKREFKYLVIKGPGNLTEQEIGDMNALISRFENHYATATICEYNNPNNCTLKLDPHIEAMLREKNDFDELAYYWTEWHNVMSEGVEGVKPEHYKTFVDFQTKIAVSNGYDDMGELWMQNYDTGVPGWNSNEFKQKMLDFWDNLQPYYNVLHAYVRMKLRQNPLYEGKIKKYGMIPANLMGNMWSQDWSKLEASTKPYPDVPNLDATEAMIKKGYTPRDLFVIAEKFFFGLGLGNMSQTFWDKSMLVRPDDVEDVVCHASAEDFCLGAGNEDFRIKQCTQVNHKQLITAHHEMGHIKYFEYYTDLHYTFRTSANDGFHEAIGDALALAVTTPKHLQCYLELDMGLDIDCTPPAQNKAEEKSPTVNAVTEMDINSLYMAALQKLVFFPFAISMDAWRWDAFDGSIAPEQYNERWWELREKFQGVTPPLGKRDPSAFDPSAKYHIVANVEYLRYFISHIVQFQFYQSMCEEAGEFDSTDPDTKPLYQCDFSDNTDAGAILGDMMKLGFSKPWPEALLAISQTNDMNVGPLIEYFKPLFQYMETELENAGEIACFGGQVKCQEEAQRYLAEVYEPEALRLANKLAIAEWNFQTNITDENEKAATEANIEWANFTKKSFDEAIGQFDWEYFVDDQPDAPEKHYTKRQLKFLNAIGTAALSPQDLIKYNQVSGDMQRIYSTAKICPYENQECDLETEGWALNPHLEERMALSKDFDELEYIWTNWRRVSGREMRGLYNDYLDITQRAADADDFETFGDYWLMRYEAEDFRGDMAKIWEEVKPLYMELHAYVRHRLSEKYPNHVKPTYPIPANILGNMWAQSWGAIFEDVIPYEGEPIFNIEPYLKANYNETKESITALFDVADEFFTATGLPTMNMSYADPPGLGMILRPDDREVVCHASAWDFSTGEDFRIKMCTRVTQEDFITVHHELGHIQYDINYKGYPLVLREGANPGFHEAIGDVISLSVATPKHMMKIGFMPNDTETTPESTINYLMSQALDKVAFLPFGFLIDSYRWKLFDGSIPRQNLTYNWLKMRSEFQGIMPPSKRNEEDFDAGSKYHVPASTPYIRYFVSFILQFQVHQHLCAVAGEPAEIHDCDIYQNQDAGNAFKKILEAGASKNWKDLLEEVIGTRELNASAILQYFKPLQDFLVAERTAKDYAIGWDENAFEEMYEFPPTPEPTTPEPTTPEPTTPEPTTPVPTTPEPTTLEPDSAREFLPMVTLIIAMMALLKNIF